MTLIKKNRDFAIYGGFIDDDNEILSCTSGGIATALSKQIIKNGGYVAGVAYSDDFYKAEYILTNKLEDLEKFKGSKYIEVDKNTVYKNIKRLLEQKKTVLFIGLPCAVAALYKFLGTRDENLLSCELICHGPTSSKVHYEYISFLERKYKSKVIAFSVRHKKDEWLPGYLYAKFENGKIFEKPFVSTEYGVAFSVFGRDFCYNCQFRGDNRQGDIMIGDFWGATDKDIFWNKKGVSVIFAETEKGNNALADLSSVKLFPTTFEKAIEHNQMVIKSRRKNPNREKFERLFASKGLIYAANHCVNTKQNIKNTIIKCITRKTVPLIRKFSENIKAN